MVNPEARSKEPSLPPCPAKLGGDALSPAEQSRLNGAHAKAKATSKSKANPAKPLKELGAESDDDDAACASKAPGGRGHGRGRGRGRGRGASISDACQDKGTESPKRRGRGGRGRKAVREDEVKEPAAKRSKTATKKDAKEPATERKPKAKAKPTATKPGTSKPEAKPTKKPTKKELAVQEGKKILELKALKSRKSCAYHRALKEAEAEGKDAAACKEAAKAVTCVHE